MTVSVMVIGMMMMMQSRHPKMTLRSIVFAGVQVERRIWR